jgi:DNA-directed RNA polymerase subunit RPC12/RpoP
VPRDVPEVVTEDVAEVAHRDYRCLECGTAFSLSGRAAGVSVPCPVCGSMRSREHWESRVRNAARTSDERFEELRDRPG